MAYILLDRSTNRFFSVNENEDTELFSEIRSFAKKVDKETKDEAKRKASKWKRLADNCKDPSKRKLYLKRAAKWAAIAAGIAGLAGAAYVGRELKAGYDAGTASNRKYNGYYKYNDNDKVPSKDLRRAAQDARDIANFYEDKYKNNKLRNAGLELAGIRSEEVQKYPPTFRDLAHLKHDAFKLDTIADAVDQGAVKNDYKNIMRELR
jgi:hypothetical protein